MRFASLGSGSRGNATLIEQGSTLLMVDNGFSPRQAVSRLQRLGYEPEQLTAILVTHEHSDHCAGAEKLASKYGIPLWASHGTAMAIGAQHYQCFDSHQAFELASIRVTPVAVPHDAREPTQFVFEAAGIKLGVLTDTGSITAHIRNAYSGCHGLLLECNYDHEMLLNGVYPQKLKQRVSGDWGHLSNQQAADLLTELDLSALRHLVLGHISEKNNQPQLARQAILNALPELAPIVTLAQQEHGFDWCDLAASVPTQDLRQPCCN